MKQPEPGVDAVGEEAEEACASEAKEALRHGQARPAGHYVRDIGHVLARLADMFAPAAQPSTLEWHVQLLAQSRGGQSSAEQQTEPVHQNEDWEGTRDQIDGAIKNGSVELIGWYLRDAAEVLGHLAAALAPPQKSRSWRLEFVRRGRGRRHDPTSSLMTKSKRAMELRFAARRLGKQEAAIAEHKGEPGRSRASLFRAKTRPRSKSHETE